MYGVGGERRARRGVAASPVAATRARARCGPATAPTRSASTTSGARCSTRSTCTPGPASSCPSRCGRCSSGRSSCAAEHWEEPDRGIWEVRGEPQHFTSSKLMCWVALDRGARLARMHDEPEYAEKWQALADQIHADICRNGVDDRGVFVQRYGADALDASLLLLPLMRFLPAGRPAHPGHRAGHRRRADGRRARAALPGRGDRRRSGRRGGHASRSARSGWSPPSSRSASSSEARKLCERLLAYASPLELYAEEIDPYSGRHLGNFPQAFTHLALINAVMHVIRAESRLLPAGIEPARPVPD